MYYEKHYDMNYRRVSDHTHDAPVTNRKLFKNV